MNINLVYPSKYLKAADLGNKQVTVTIKNATMEEMGHGAEKETKLVLWFERATKGMILNRTNAMIIASMYTPETDNWAGQQITLYATKVKAFGAVHDAVRVREQIPARNVGAARMPDAMQEAPPIDDEEDLLDVDEGNGSPTVHGADEDVDYYAAATPQQAATALSDDLAHSEPEAQGTPPHNRLWGIGMAVFGPDWGMARPWLIKKWTAKVSPDNVRTSSSDLSDDEKTMLGDYLNESASALQKVWPKQKAIIVQATNGVAVPA